MIHRYRLVEFSSPERQVRLQVILVGIAAILVAMIITNAHWSFGTCPWRSELALPLSADEEAGHTEVT